jgi:uncharacterized iron-regulated protein
MVLLLLALLTLAACANGEDGSLWDVEAGEAVALEEIVGKLGDAELVYVGESHDEQIHHDFQLHVIRSMFEAGEPVAVGLEMMQARDQAALDAFIAGEMDEEEFEGIFLRNWGEMWPLYRDIFRYCREHRIPMVALNVPRAITRKVAREGFASLTEAERGELPPVACRVDEAYENFLRAVLGSHAGDSSFRNFCEAQVVWDTAMAFHSLEYLAANPETTLIVLTGTIHAWRKAMPYQAVTLDDDVGQIVILPWEEGRLEPDLIGPADADYLYGMQ